MFPQIYSLFTGCLNRFENPSPHSIKLHVIKTLKYHIMLSLSTKSAGWLVLPRVKAEPSAVRLPSCETSSQFRFWRQPTSVFEARLKTLLIDKAFM